MHTDYDSHNAPDMPDIPATTGMPITLADVCAALDAGELPATIKDEVYVVNGLDLRRLARRAAASGVAGTEIPVRRDSDFGVFA